jgi:zinc transporter ZupT
VGRRLGSLLLFVGGYLAMASLSPLTALVPALLSFFAGVLVLIREPRGQPQPSRR